MLPVPSARLQLGVVTGPPAQPQERTPELHQLRPGDSATPRERMLRVSDQPHGLMKNCGLTDVQGARGAAEAALSHHALESEELVGVHRRHRYQ